jgi:multidrug transporter EmrE-like cation transporter
MKGWLFLVIAIVGEVIATSALKSSEGFTKLAPITTRQPPMINTVGIKQPNCFGFYKRNNTLEWVHYR